MATRQEEITQEVARKQAVLVRLKNNLSDENKALRRIRLPTVEDVKEEEDSILRQIEKFQALLQEGSDGN